MIKSKESTPLENPVFMEGRGFVIIRKGWKA
jgi:hypothetical protein